MLKAENRYEFKKELLQVHKKDRRDFTLTAKENEFEVFDRINIVVPRGSDDVIMTAAKDLVDYLLTSMELSSMIVYDVTTVEPCLAISVNKDIGDGSAYMGYRISVTDNGITLEGYDSKGVAQGIYFLEDLMNIRKGPFLEKKITARRAVFSKRTVQSPFGVFEYPDECLAIIAHMGYDTIILWINDLNISNRGDFIDIAHLCDRAEKYGIGVQVKLFKVHEVDPDDPEAEEYYEGMYGELLKNCPKITGITIIEEAARLKGKKPSCTANIPNRDLTMGGIPSLKYAKLMQLLERVIHRINPDVELVLSTYNWGGASAEKRNEVLEALPKNVTINIGWDLHHKYKIGNVAERVADYSLRFAEAGEYFVNDAKTAKKLGLNVEAISNTAGRTWDFGCAPYEPMPYQWIRRYEETLKAHDEWGVNELVECIHYGFHPSFIGELEKWAFFSPKEDLHEVLHKILKRDFGEENFDAVDKAMRLWSEAITHYVPTNEDQYGPFRIGPSYPLWINDDAPYYPDGGRMPFESYAMYKDSMYRPIYAMDPYPKHSLWNNRFKVEMEELAILTDLLDEGIKSLQTIKDPNKKLARLINLGKYLYRNCVTTKHVKELYMLKHEFLSAKNPADAMAIVQKIEKLFVAEKENVEATIPIVQADSRLGWEPSMEYVGDEKCLQWKLRQLKHEMTITLANYKNSIEITGQV